MRRVRGRVKPGSNRHLRRISRITAGRRSRSCHTYSIRVPPTSAAAARRRQGATKDWSIALTAGERFRISRANRAPARLARQAHRGAQKLRAAPIGVQRRHSRETDVSAEQIGAQAPARFPRAHVDQGRPQGSCGAARAWTQAAQCLIVTPVRWSSSGSNAGAIFAPPRAVRGLPRRASSCRLARAAIKVPPASASPCRGRSATPWNATACAVDCARW
jgi:hypothetical protein